MGYADEWNGAEYGQWAELAAVTIDAGEAAWEAANDDFDAEIDSWARHALAANGFGDY